MRMTKGFASYEGNNMARELGSCNHDSVSSRLTSSAAPLFCVVRMALFRIASTSISTQVRVDKGTVADHRPGRADGAEDPSHLVADRCGIGDVGEEDAVTDDVAQRRAHFRQRPLDDVQDVAGLRSGITERTERRL